MFCLSNVHVLPVKRARLERKTTRKKVCAERLLVNGNKIGKIFVRIIHACVTSKQNRIKKVGTIVNIIDVIVMVQG